MIAPVGFSGLKPSLFQLGTLCATRNAAMMFMSEHETPTRYIERHVTGDWGDLGDDDARVNEKALVDGSRIFSMYRTTKGTRFYVITEADRSSTTILLPEEY